jgi:maltokinase-like protein
MSFIHRTTMSPTKLELLATWLPRQPWYRGTAGQAPVLSRAGGFRLDDPAGEVGLEFMAVRDTSGAAPVTYHVPMAYRGAPLPGGEHALLGTAEHGVLGKRWLYDGAHDPVLADQLCALLRGEAEPQAQSVSDTPDLTVAAEPAGPGLTAATVRSVADGPDGTDLLTDAGLVVRVLRVLTPAASGAAPAPAGQVTADWRLPDDTTARGPYVTVHTPTTS